MEKTRDWANRLEGPVELLERARLELYAIHSFAELVEALMVNIDEEKTGPIGGPLEGLISRGFALARAISGASEEVLDATERVVDKLMEEKRAA